MDVADEKSKILYGKVFQWIVDSLFDRMIMLDEQENSAEFIHCLATVYSFTKSCPELLRETQISMLQPYLFISSDVCIYNIELNCNTVLIFDYRKIGLKHVTC